MPGTSLTSSRYARRTRTHTHTGKHPHTLLQRYTQSGGRRPFGVSTIIAGIDDDGKNALYLTDPSGSYARWKAVACGRNHKTVLEYLEAQFKEGLDDHETLKMAVRGLLEVVDQGME